MRSFLLLVIFVVVDCLNTENIVFAQTPERVTCSFTADNEVVSVFLNGNDVTAQVTGTLNNWQVPKTHSFDNPTQTFSPSGSVYAFMMKEFDATASTSASGFMMACTSNLTNSPWTNSFSTTNCTGFRSTSTSTSNNPTYTNGVGNRFPTNWFLTSTTNSDLANCVTSTSGFNCNTGGCNGANKLWLPNVGTNYQNAAIRIIVQGSSFMAPTNAPTTAKPTTKTPTKSPTSPTANPTTPIPTTAAPITSAPTICPTCTTVTCQFMSNKRIIEAWINDQPITLNSGFPQNTLYTTAFQDPEVGVTFAFKIDSEDTFCNGCGGLKVSCTASKTSSAWNNLVSIANPTNSRWSGFVLESNSFIDQWYSQFVTAPEVIVQTSASVSCCGSAQSVWPQSRGRFVGLKLFVGNAAPTKSPTTLPPVPTLVPTIPQICPNGWQAFNGRCFQVMQLAKSHSASNTECSVKLPGSSLAALNSLEELAYATTLGCADKTPPRCWVGLFQTGSQANNVWSKSDGTGSYFFNQSHWTASQPDDLSSTGSSPANCAGFASNTMADFDCDERFFGLCSIFASCPAGFRKVSDYLVINSSSISSGRCDPCSPGTFRNSSMPETACSDCAGGVTSSTGSTICSDPCPAGYYCPPGTGSLIGSHVNKPVPCSAGLRNPSTGKSSPSDCIACPAGFFCLEGTVTTSGLCRAGRCGNQLATSDLCSQDCTPGFVCETGAVCPGTRQCGLGNFCPRGSSVATQATVGFLLVGGNQTTRSAQEICPRGSYCVNGERFFCPRGTYGDQQGQSSEAVACKPCNAGFFCDFGSESPNSESCSPSNATVGTEASYYCPAGTASRLQVGNNFMTIPETSLVTNRQNFVSCPANKVCLNGIASPKATIDFDLSDCGKVVSIAEKSAINSLVAKIRVKVNPAVLSPVTRAYSLVNFTFADQTQASNCEPGTNATRNGNGLFAMNPSTGDLFLSRADLNFEVCLPVIDVRYTATLQAIVTIDGLQTILRCDTTVQVLDVNDQPVFASPIAHRMIREKQPKNTQAISCNSEGMLFGCPVNETFGNPEIKVFDEDDGSVIVYTMSPGPHTAILKIHPCTGIISYQDDFELSYLPGNTPIPIFEFIVTATDDGGANSVVLSANQTVRIYLVNVNDPPVLVSPLAYRFSVPENRLVNTVLSTSVPGPYASDEDANTLSYSLFLNENGAFLLNASTGVVSLSTQGAALIDFETKLLYSIGIIVSDGLSATQALYQVDILDSNDAPKFDSSRSRFFIAENSLPGSLVCTNANGVCDINSPTAREDHAVKIRDEDSKSLTTDKTIFSLVTGTEWFTINSTTGLITVNSNPAMLDFENVTRAVTDGRLISVTVLANSTGEGIDSPQIPLSTQFTVSVFIVDVNEPPAIGSSSDPYIISVLESWPESINIDFPSQDLLTSDPDNADASQPGNVMQTVTFTIDSTGTNVDGAGIFTVSKSITNPSIPVFRIRQALDFETLPTNDSICGVGHRCYQVRLRATDDGPGTRQFVTRDIIMRIIDTNEVPFFQPRSEVLFSESSTVFEVDEAFGAIDPDASTTLSYSIVSGSASYLFSTAPNGVPNQIKFVRNPNAFADFERARVISLTLRAMDNGPSPFIGKRCQFNAAQTELVINCGLDGGAFCNQTDSRCYETCVSTNLEPSAVQVSSRPRKHGFFCNYANGEIPSVSFPQEAQQEIIFRIQDANEPPFIIVDPSAIPSTGEDYYNFTRNCSLIGSVSSQRSAQIQTAIGDLEVFDDDNILPSISFSSNGFIFSKTNSNDPFWSTFNLDPITGRISSIANQPLPVNTTASAQITVSDKVNPPLSSTCNVSVNIIPLANTLPSINQGIVVGVNENVAIGTVIVTPAMLYSSIEAVDEDIALGQTVSFSSSFSTWYDVNPATGAVTIKGVEELNYEALSGFTPPFALSIFLRVTDSVGGSGSTTIQVNIVDVNEAPFWNLPIPPILLNENSPSGTLVIRLSDGYANDPDLQKNLTYSLISCGLNCPFNMLSNSSAGEIVVRNGNPELNFESSRKVFSLLVRVSDAGGLSSTTTITVNLVDVNERPAFTSTVLSPISIPEDSSPSALFDFSNILSDPDENDLTSTLNVTLSGVESTIFFVQDGILKLRSNASIDYETKDTYVFSAFAQDRSGLISAATQITINIVDVNDVSITTISASNNGVMSCSQNNSITIVGRNFGFKNHSLSSSHVPIVEVSYVYTNVASLDVPTRYFASGCSVQANDNTVIICTNAPPGGIGTNLVFQVRIQVPNTSLSFNRTFASRGTSIRFESPTITGFSSNTNSFLTVGNQTFTITGTCLGRISDNVTLNHGLASGRDSLISYCSSVACYFPRCVANSNNGTTLLCTSRPGLGKDFVWNLRIALQPANSITFGSYGSPILTSKNFATDIPSSGIFPQPLILSGINFGDTGEIPTRAEVIYSYVRVDNGLPAIERIPLIGCAVSSNPGLRNQISCTRSGLGFGRNLSVIIEFGGLSNANNQVFLSFAQPSLLSISGDGAVGADTLGGQLVTLNGTGFGPACGEAASDSSSVQATDGTPCGYLSVEYSRGSRKASNSNEILVYLPPCAVVNDAIIVCKIIPGTGEGHVWKLILAGQLVFNQPSVQRTSYARPAVGGYSGDGAQNAVTIGNENIEILGSNFGPPDGALVEAFYGNSFHPLEFKALNCRVVSQFLVTCLTAQGAGDQLIWTLFIDGLQSRSETTNYGRPEILSLEGLPTGGFLSPDGQETFIIVGKNFGPPETPFLESVFYGPSGNIQSFVPSNCVVLSHERIQCNSVPGVGTDMSFLLVVKGQFSLPSSVTISYQPVSLVSLSSTSGSSAGGYLMNITGSGLAVCDPNAIILVRTVQDNSVVSVSKMYSVQGNQVSANISLSCPLSGSGNLNRIVEFVVPPRIGSKSISFQVEMKSTRHSQAISSTSLPLSFQYNTPVLERAFGEPGLSPSLISVTALGSNFCSSPACCRPVVSGQVVPPSAILIHNHNRIKFQVARVGPVFIACDNEEFSNTVEFGKASPFISGTKPSLGEFDFSTLGQENFTVYSVSAGVDVQVKIGDVFLDVLSHTFISCSDPSLPDTSKELFLDVSAECYATVVRTKPGAGRNLPLVIVTPDLNSVPDDPRFEFFNYKRPVITSITGAGPSNAFATSGALANQLITIRGTDFFSNGEVFISNVENGIVCIPTFYNGTLIICRVGEGEGLALKVTIKVAGSSSDSFGGQTDSIFFLLPSNARISNEPVLFGFDTQGNEELLITGSNFGRNLKQTVTIGNVPCTVISSNHTFVRCTTPVGEGSRYGVQICVLNSGCILSQNLFSYGAPIINQVSPATGPTKGLTENNEPILLTLRGRNFGSDQVSLVLDGIILGQRNSSVDADLLKPFVFVSHTEMHVFLPSHYGANLPFIVRVKDQEFVGSTSKPVSVFSYQTPVITSVTFSNAANSTTQAPVGNNPPPPTRAGFGNIVPGRRILQSQPFGEWRSRDFSSCLVDYKNPRIFIRTFWVIQVSGSFVETVESYSDSSCINLLSTTTMIGNLFDLGTNPSVRCGQSVRVDVSQVNTRLTNAGLGYLKCSCSPTSAGVTSDITSCVQNPNFANDCPDFRQILYVGSRFAFYVIVDDSELYLTLRRFNSLLELQSSTGFGFDDEPTAVASSIPPLIGPVFPTDGCFRWEELSVYNERKIQAQTNFGITDLPRNCEDKAFLELSGDNFGINPFSVVGVLRVFFENLDTGESFEASTTSSDGNHNIRCTEILGCRHDHNGIKVWVPFGSGRGLRVRVQIGTLDLLSNITVHYLPPSIDGVFPGSLFRKAGFQDADGERIAIVGSNFGFTGSSADILLNGQACKNPEWLIGSDGEPFVECETTRDVVGPKNILACIATQTFVGKIFKTDAQVLASGEQLGVWDTNSADSLLNSIYTSRVFSYAVSKCGPNKYGRLFELCSPCPVGALCDGGFDVPKAVSGFFNIEINRTKSPERAAERCGEGSFAQNELLTESFVNAVARDTCLDYVKCEPEEACIGGNECAPEYQYALNECTAARSAVDNAGSFVSKEGVVVQSNACGVRLNPFTLEYEGVHSDCRGDTPLDVQCDFRRPWECSHCLLEYPSSTDISGNVSVPIGRCSCVPSSRCALCTMYTHYRISNACKKCPENVALLISLFIVAVIAAVFAAYYLSKRKVNLAFLAIAVDYFQVIAIFSTTRITWPPAILRLLEILTLFNLNIDIAAPECILPSFDYSVKFYATEFVPAAGLALLILAHVLYTAYKIFRDRGHVRLGSHINKLVSTFMIIMIFSYLMVTRRALDVFNCNPQSPSDGFLYTEFTSFDCDGGGLCRCNEPGGLQQRLVPAAYAFLLIYSFGFPLFVFLVVRFNHHKIVEDQYLRAYQIGDTRDSNPDCYDLRKRYHLLYYYYKPTTPYWLLFVLARKFGVAMSALLFRGNPTFQMSMILLILFWSFVMQARFRPYLSTGERALVIKDLEVRASLAINDPITYGKDYELMKKVNACVRLAQEQQRRSKEQAAKNFSNKFWDDPVTASKNNHRLRRNAAVRYFFDFNSAELILIGCAIFICICGIMFESGRFDLRPDLIWQRDLVTYTLIIVVASSFIYLFLIVLSESTPYASFILSRFMKHDNESRIEDKNLDAGVQVNENPLMNVRVIGAANADDLATQLESNMEALTLTRKQNMELEKELRNSELALGLKSTTTTTSSSIIVPGKM